MEKEFWTIGEIVEVFQVQEDLIHMMEREQVITFCSDGKESGKLLPSSEIEKIQLAKTLIEDMDVNIPGVEVILHMGQNMIEMRCQFDEILKQLAEEFTKLLSKLEK